MKTKTHELIDRRIEESQGSGSRREHLGASVVGDDCARKVWYIFRWARQVRHKARILRLFDRGNREEERFVMWLRRAGVHTLDIDPETGKQFRVSDVGGHFGGSLDAILYDIPDLPGNWVLGEFKTHNDKSFKDIVRNGLRKSKWQHYIQMVIYIHKKGLSGGLYLAINKNDDDLHTEFIYPDDETALRYIDRGRRIVFSREPPVRINESPAWYQCTFCDMKDICHNGEPMAVNCRTCAYSVPREDGTWFCEMHHCTLDEARQKIGCLSHTPIPS